MKKRAALDSKSIFIRFIPLAVLVLGLFLHNSQAQSIEVQDRAMIRPSIIHLDTGEEQQFKIVLKATRLNAASNPDEVQWSVNDIEGGNNTVGTISEEGVYQAPDNMPSPREIHIGGYTEEAQNKMLYATVIIGEEPPTYETKTIWTKPLNGDELQISSPHGFGLDREGNVLVADQGGDQVLRFTAEGKFLDEIGDGSGESPGQFKEPREVRSDSEGNIYVTDSKGDDPRIQVFSDEGEFLRIFGEKGRGPGQVLRAHGIGFGPDQKLYITDVDNMRVNVYDTSGEFLYDFSSWSAYNNMNPGEMNASHGMFADQNGDAFVNSYYGPTHKFTPKGTILAEFAHGDPPNGSVYFHNINGDRWGNVYIMARPEGGAEQSRVDKENAISVMKYNNNGDFVTEWSYSDPQHRETTAAVDDNDVFYAMYVTSDEMVVEIFEEQ
jgi:sugar lactone lactonase YvrE